MTPPFASADEVFRALHDLGLLPTPTVAQTLDWHLLHDLPVVGEAPLSALFAGFVHDGATWRTDVRLGYFDRQGRRHVPTATADKDASWLWWAPWNGVPNLPAPVGALPS